MDPIGRFATVHFSDRQTDRQTDRPTDTWARRQFYSTSAYARYIDGERRANNTNPKSQP